MSERRSGTEQLLPGIGLEPQIRDLAQQVLLVCIETVHELWVLQRLLALLRRHALKRSQSAVNELLAILREMAPARSQVIDNFFALVRRHAFEEPFTVTHGLSLLRRQLIPTVKIAPNLFLPLRREIAESRIVAHETLLLFRRAVAQVLDPLWRQTHQRAGIRLALLLLRLLFGPPLLTNGLPLRPRDLALCAQKASLRRRRASETRREEQRCKHRAELEESTHYESRLNAAP